MELKKSITLQPKNRNKGENTVPINDINNLISLLNAQTNTAVGYGGVAYEIKQQNKLANLKKLGKKNPCNFKGIYVIYSDKNKIIYVGESYKRTVGERLADHASGKLSRSAFARHLAEEKFGKNIGNSQIIQLCNEIDSYYVLPIQCNDLETLIIEATDAPYNKIGKKSNKTSKTTTNQNINQTGQNP